MLHFHLTLGESEMVSLGGIIVQLNQVRSDFALVELSKKLGASLVAQWLRICLLMQGTRVRAQVWEDPTCHGAAGPVSHSC